MKENETDNYESINELDIAIIDFIKNSMKSIETYSETEKQYLISNIPVMVNVAIQRLKDILYINITSKLVSFDDGYFENFVKSENVWLCTYFYTKFLNNEKTFDCFIDKIKPKIDKLMDSLINHMDAEGFIVLTTNIFDNVIFSKMKTEINNMKILKNEIVDEKFISNLLYELINTVDYGTQFQQFRVHFKQLEVSDGIEYTNFTILFNVIQYCNTYDAMYFVIDLVNDDNDWDLTGLQNTGLHGEFRNYGVALLALRPGQEALSIFKLTPVSEKYLDSSIEKITKNICSSIKMLSNTCIVKEITIDEVKGE